VILFQSLNLCHFGEFLKCANRVSACINPVDALKISVYWLDKCLEGNPAWVRFFAIGTKYNPLYLPGPLSLAKGQREHDDIVLKEISPPFSREGSKGGLVFLKILTYRLCINSLT